MLQPQTVVAKIEATKATLSDYIASQIFALGL